MLDSLIARLWLGLDQVALIAALVVIGAAFTWQLGRFSMRAERRGTGALTAVMDATVERHDLAETLGRLIRITAEQLSASSGAIYLNDGAEGWALVHAIGVIDVARLAHIPTHDALARRASQSPDDSIIRQVDEPWAALGRAVAVARFGVARPGRRTGLLALGWSSTHEARSMRASVDAIARYAGRVLADFEAIAARAHDVRVLGRELQRREALTRAAAHDLLNSLSAACDALEESPADEATALAVAQLHLAAHMLTDLRDPDRVLDRQPVPVESLVELASGLMALHTSDLPVSFAVRVEPGLPDVLGDRVELVRVLDNLLANAVRHNADAPELHVSLTVESREDGAQFTVADDGAGFTPESLANAFTFGVHADSAGRAVGSGMGLWSCRRIVEAHGGRIWIENEPGRGAHVCVVLPIARAEVEPA